MSREKQIEELAFVLGDICNHIPLNRCYDVACNHCTATHLYNIGYRKQNEVEKLVQDVTRLEQEIETLKDNNEHLTVVLEEAKSEVAREIFEEIKYNFAELRKIRYANPAVSYMFDLLDYLEKKYTEGQK